MPRNYSKPIRPIFIPIGPSIAYVTLTKGFFALIDSWNAERIGRHDRYANWNHHTNSYYATRKLNGRGWKMHREILRISKGVVGDHIQSRRTLDNREANLRSATPSQNSMNRKMQANNTSGLRGVMWHKRIKMWQAAIRVNRKAIHLGYFSTKEAAYAAYCSAALKYHCQFAGVETCANVLTV